MTFSKLSANQGVQIIGANDGDVLIIGSGANAGTYTYDTGSGDWVSGTDTITWLTP